MAQSVPIKTHIVNTKYPGAYSQNLQNGYINKNNNCNHHGMIEFLCSEEHFNVKCTANLNFERIMTKSGFL